MPTYNFCPACAQPLVERVEAGKTRQVCSAAGCRFVHYDNPLPVVAAIVEDGDDVILVRSKGWPEKWFGLVTGFLEGGETPEAGVLREVNEELGLDGTVVRLIGVYPFLEQNQLIVAYHVRASGAVLLGEELASIKRVPSRKLRPWRFGTGQAVADWLASRPLDQAEA